MFGSEPLKISGKCSLAILMDDPVEDTSMPDDKKRQLIDAWYKRALFPPQKN